MTHHNLPSYKEALSLVDKPKTALKHKRYRKHIALSPKYIGNELSGIDEILSHELISYSSVLRAIPIAFNKPQLAQKYAAILDENPFMHFEIEVECVIFQPKPGDVLKGIVNKLGEDHVGCLVHGTFNSSIHRPRQSSDNKNWAGKFLQVGDEVVFEVVELNVRGVLSMYGKFTDRFTRKVQKKHCHFLNQQSTSKDISCGDTNKTLTGNGGDSGVEMNSPEIVHKDNHHITEFETPEKVVPNESTKQLLAKSNKKRKHMIDSFEETHEHSSTKKKKKKRKSVLDDT